MERFSYLFHHKTILILQKEPLVKLLSYILPAEFTEYFDLIDVKEEERNQELLLHLYLNEKDIQPAGHSDLQANVFYGESCINDFPIRDHRTVLTSGTS